MRAAIVGLGWWGKHIIRRMQGSSALKITLAVDTNPATADFAREHGIAYTADFNAALQDPAIDAVILCTPHSAHTGQVLAIAAAGKHVFCEKPLALTRIEAERSVAACKGANVMLGIGHERRFEPALVEVRRLVRSGELGTIMHAEAHFSHDKLANAPKGDWRTSPKDAPAAGMTAMGIHLTDLFIDLFGPVSEAYAVTTSRVAYEDNGDVISAHLRFASGATGYLNAILVTPLYIAFKVFGSQGWVEVRSDTHPDTPGPARLTVQPRNGEAVTREFPWHDTVRENLELFARASRDEADYPFTDAQKIANIATLEAICMSARENRPVAVTL
jgi:predicted dehydrogenase